MYTFYIGKFSLFSVDRCQSDFTTLTYMCLWVSSFRRTWSDAKYECELRGGRLPIVNSAEKQADVQMFVQHISTTSKTVLVEMTPHIFQNIPHHIPTVIFLSY